MPRHDALGDEAALLQTDNVIRQFFTEMHMENGKMVPAQELVTARSETVGVGDFSRVRLVEVKTLPAYVQKHAIPTEGGDDKHALVPEVHGVFALKVIKKTEVVRLKQTQHIKSEALVLSQVSHPFIVNLYHRFQDERHLYLLEEFVQCGQLWTLIQSNGCLPNEVARFFAAQICMAIQALHTEHIVYRDLNPSNVLLDRGLYIKLVDFGLAKVMNFDDPSARTWTLCGSPEYLAPEIITSKGHSKEVDWWALGIIIHEMLAGYPPHYAANAFDIYKLVLNSKTTPSTLPKHFEVHGKDLLGRLLTKEVGNRIGSSKNGAEDIKKHKWYRGLNWAALYNKQMPPPMDGLEHVPSVAAIGDVSNFNNYPTSNDENGPVLDADKDSYLFSNWESLSKEGDVKDR